MPVPYAAVSQNSVAVQNILIANAERLADRPQLIASRAQRLVAFCCQSAKRDSSTFFSGYLFFISRKIDIYLETQQRRNLREVSNVIVGGISR